jgi:crossover junction endodeoxyribonuclease RuvC
MRVMGIDCGTERTGYGIIESDGHCHRILAAGTIRTDPREPLHRRLQAIAGGLRDIVAAHRPDAVAVEEVFHAVNVKSALKLAHVRGVALLVAAEAGLPLAEYSPLVIKGSVVGYGRAEKSQVQFMVGSLLGPAAPLEQPDACDALAAAICHANHSRAAALQTGGIA